MRMIYLDNFRGFQNELIPIEQVNFLVGENSTGKSSFLGLLNLFSKPNFWINQEFNTEEFNFGNFDDIVSINSKDKSSFRIGIIECLTPISKLNKKDTLLAILMEFIQKNGIPQIKRYCYLNQHRSVEIIISNNEYKSRITEKELANCPREAIVKSFKEWLRVSPIEFKGFVPLKIPYNRKFPLMAIANYIDKKGNINLFKKEISLEIAIPGFLEEIIWIGPLRSKPHRTYDQLKYSFSPEGEHAPYWIKRILESSNKEHVKDFLGYIKSFGKNSGLLSGVKINRLGKHNASPFELDILLENIPLNINYVGYGVSQCLPILIEMYIRPHKSWFSIQQPEVHLHPRAQAALGNVIFNLAENERKGFFIETHSDYIIDRFRYSVCKTKKHNLSSQILFFERLKGINKVSDIDILKNGKYAEKQPPSFRKFFIKEQLSLLGI